MKNQPQNRNAEDFDILPKTTLALSLSMAFGGFAAAQDEEAVVLDTLRIEERTIDTNPYSEAGAPYKARTSGDSRHVKPLAETPQTIEVLTQTRIEESGKSDLRDVLSFIPGITIGTGENGNAFGDRYIIRGHEARSDVFVDGLRDPGMTTRETFATEQIEITKGPSSTFAGRGSTGGAVNSITKKASSEYDFINVRGGLGTDEYHRVTVDGNKRISDSLAARVNFLHSYKEIPDRGPADEERLGALLSATWLPTDRLKLIADYYHLNAEDIPDLGTYFVDGTPEKNPPTYVQRDRDFLDTEVNAATLKAHYEFSDALRLENGMRYGETKNGYVNSNATTRGVTSSHNGWQEADYFGNQLNLFHDAEIAGREHRLVFGVEYTNEDVLNGRYDIDTACWDEDADEAISEPCYVDRDGAFGPSLQYRQAAADGLDPTRLWSGTIRKGNSNADFDVETVSAYVMDTFDLTDRLTVFAGIRYDDFDYKNTVLPFGSQTPVTYRYSDELWNYHGSLSYEFLDDAMVYVTYSTSSNINGGESDVGGNCGYGGICGDSETIGLGDPEDTENFELGMKWDLMDRKLLASVAAFQITKDDVMESASANAYETSGSYNTGENRVRGVEFSLVGNVTEALSVQLSAALMNSEIRDSYRDGVNEVCSTSRRTGQTTCSKPNDIGKDLGNFADESANLQLRYALTEQAAAGVSVTYKGEMYVGQPDAAASYRSNAHGTYRYTYKVPSYMSTDIFASYKIGRHFSVRLNVNNVFDEDIYTAAYRSGSFVYLGERRNGYVTLAYDF